MKKCLYCKNKIKKGRIKFCSERCGLNYRANKLYHRKKNDEDFKKLKQRNFNRWLNKNREYFNDYMRPINRLAQAKRREERKKNGLCPTCGKKRKNTKYVTCEKCRR